MRSAQPAPATPEPARRRLWTALLTALAMLAFAGNSLLCRLALRTTEIHPAGFTAARIGSAALVLWLLAPRRSATATANGSWLSGFALFAYAAAFSFAYVELSAGVGALVLFGAVQLTMIGWALWRGERFRLLQAVGIATAAAGLVALLLPAGGTGRLAPAAVAMMLIAGVAWGVYSLRGRGTSDPIAATRANFLLALPFAAALLVAFIPQPVDARGLALAVASGVITSGAGYMVWYAVLPRLRGTQAATVQLSVPPLAAALGFVLLGENLTAAQWFAAAAVLAGVWLTLRR